MRTIGRLQNFGAGKTAALAVLALAAGSVSLRADMACLSDCGQATSRLAAISGFEDVETDSSGFNIFFKPWLPVYSVPPSDLADNLNSGSTNHSQDGWGDAGTLTFLKGRGSSDASSDDGSSKSGGSSDPVSTLLNQITNPQASSGTHDGPVALDPDPPTPTPTPEPRYSGFAMLGLGWAGLVGLRRFKALRAFQRES